MASGDNRVVVAGTVSVRTVGFNVPGDALAIGRRLTKTPPVDRHGNTIHLRPPRVQHPFFEGTTDTGRAAGKIGRGGPSVVVTSRSGQVSVQGS